MIQVSNLKFLIVLSRCFHNKLFTVSSGQEISLEKSLHLTLKPLKKLSKVKISKFLKGKRDKLLLRWLNTDLNLLMIVLLRLLESSIPTIAIM